MSTAITVAMINDLRQRTGVGMTKCKDALVKADGDIDLAIANLRKDGLATAVKKEGREAKEGLIGVAESDKGFGIVEVNAETDFVARNDRFLQFVKAITDEVAKTMPNSTEDFLKQKFSQDQSLTIDEYRATMVQAIGENIQIKRLLTLKKDPITSWGIYSHLGGKIVTVVELKGSNEEEALAKDIAMHAAAASPEFLNPEEVPPEVLANEKEIAASLMKDKPANMMEKIVEGKMNAYYDQVCLLKQKFIKDEKSSISELVERRGKVTGKPLQVSSFKRWQIGQ